MHTKNVILLSVVAVIALTGCNDKNNSVEESDYQGPDYGVYQGIVWGEQDQPLKAEVVVQEGHNTQLTLWDERDHQTSYIGVETGSELTFTAASVTCVDNDDVLSCENANGSTILSPVEPESVDLSSFTGAYKSRYADAIYLMEIDGYGSLTITGNNCESEGSLFLSSNPENVVNMSLSDDECLQAGDTNIVTLVVDNESLISANIQTESDNFPQVWVQL